MSEMIGTSFYSFFLPFNHLAILKAVAYYEWISFYFGIIIGGLPGRLVRLGSFLFAEVVAILSSQERGTTHAL